MRRRMTALMLIFAVIALGITAKLGYEQIIHGSKLEYGALNTRLREISTKPDRGTIFDRNGNALAISVETESLYINPSIVRKSKEAAIVAQSLSDILEIPVEKIEEKIARETSFEYIKRHVDDEKVAQIRALGYKGVYFHEETKRSYPKGSLASQIIGFAGIDNQGLNGLELSYDSVLLGQEGKFLIEYDGGGNELPQAMKDFIPAEQGSDLYLTIDETIQYIVERELKNVVTEQSAAGATALVMDVKTGALLAMANYPDYDPNHYNDVDSSVWNNPAVSGLYEPGSTFKILTSAMVLEEGVTTPIDGFYCPGYIMITKMRMNCWKRAGHGSETFTDGVANSCNPVFATVVERLGKEKFYDYLDGFGMNRKTGIDLPGEALSLMIKEDKVVPYDLAAMSIGQSNAYTPIQMITAISAVANGGSLMKPYIVDRICDKDGNLIKQVEPTVVREVISEATAREVWGILENVVSHGTGSKGKVEGYLVAGKTGTAQKVASDGGYSVRDKVVSFAGFAPADNPQIACIVIVDTPLNETQGGVVAGPVFKNILADTLRYLEVPKTVAMELVEGSEELVVPEVSPGNAVDAINAFVAAGLNPVVETQGEIMYTYTPAAGARVYKGSNVYLYCASADGNAFTMPDLSGKNIKEVDRILSGFGMTTVINGSGLAYRQSVAAGTVITPGTMIEVYFSTTPEEDAKREADSAHNSQPGAQNNNEQTGTPPGNGTPANGMQPPATEDGQLKDLVDQVYTSE